MSEIATAKVPSSLFRKIILTTMITAYSISALMGIIAVLSTDIDWRVVGTTALVGTGALIVLCSLTVANLPKWRLLGWATAVIGISTMVMSLLFVWGALSYSHVKGEYNDNGVAQYLTEKSYESLIKFESLLSVYSLILVFICLLIAATHPLNVTAKGFAYITSSLGGVVALLFTYLIVVGFDSSQTPVGLVKLTIILTILATLGVLITLTLSLIQRSSKPVASVSAGSSAATLANGNSVNKLTESSLISLNAFAEWKGMEVNEYLHEMLQREKQEDKAADSPQHSESE